MNNGSTLLSELVDAIMVREVELPDEPFIIDGLIHEEATVLYGRPETGKSYYALSIAAAVTAGTPWLGRQTRKGKVLFMGLDPGQARETRRRVEALPPDVDFMITRKRPGQTDGWWDNFAAAVKAEGVTLLIIDNLTRLMPAGASWRGDEHVNTVLNRLNMIVDAGVAVLLLHHAGKPGEDGRPKDSPVGSTAIESWARSLIRADRIKGTRNCVLYVVGNDIAPFELETVHVPDGNGEHAAFFTVVSDDTKTSKHDRGSGRVDNARQIARHYVESGVTCKSLSAVATWLVHNPPSGMEERSDEAWNKMLQRGAFKLQFLAGGRGKPVVAGPAYEPEPELELAA